MIYSSLLVTLLTATSTLALSTHQGQTPILSQDCLIELAPGEQRWVSEDEKWSLRREGVQFFDVTADPTYAPVNIQATVKYPKKLAHNESVTALFDKLDKKRLNEFLETFTSFHTRYYKSDYGRQSAEWLFGQVNASLAAAGVGDVKYFDHPWGQPSVIARIPGKSNATVVVGAHQDSINLFLPSILAAPGADDDASGSATILEALRVLLTDKAIKKAENTIEFHWYSAEEGGLLGSQAIFQSYEKQGRDVKAMLQQDMTGYTKGTYDAGKPESVGVITDFVDPGLTDFLKNVITNYCGIPYVETLCGYACSDHASANKAGYPSAFIIESEFKDSNHKHIHTTDDLLKYLDEDHMLQHARLTLGMVYELAFAKFS